MVRFTYLRKHLGAIPPSIHLADTASSAWNRLRRGNLRQPTISQLWRSAQAVPATPFGDQRRPLLPSTANENRSYTTSPWPTPLRRSKESSKLEDERKVLHDSRCWRRERVRQRISQAPHLKNTQHQEEGHNEFWTDSSINAFKQG